MMSSFGFKKHVALATMSILGVVGMGSAAYAAAPGTTTASSGTPTSSSATKAAHHRGLLARADKATVEVKVKGQWVTYTIDRGKVTAVSATSITLGLADGQPVTEAIASSTKFNGVTSASAVTVGKPAVVVSTGPTAVRVAQKTATPTPTPAPAS